MSALDETAVAGGPPPDDDISAADEPSTASLVLIVYRCLGYDSELVAGHSPKAKAMLFFLKAKLSERQSQ